MFAGTVGHAPALEDDVEVVITLELLDELLEIEADGLVVMLVVVVVLVTGV